MILEKIVLNLFKVQLAIWKGKIKMLIIKKIIFLWMLMIHYQLNIQLNNTYYTELRNKLRWQNKKRLNKFLKIVNKHL